MKVLVNAEIFCEIFSHKVCPLGGEISSQGLSLPRDLLTTRVSVKMTSIGWKASLSLSHLGGRTPDV